MFEKLLDAENLETAWHAILEKMNALGFDRCIYGRTNLAQPGYLGEQREFMVLSNFEPEYTRAYLADGAFSKSPFFIWALKNHGLASWSFRGSLDLTPAQQEEAKKIAKLNESFSVKSGYTISFGNQPSSQKSAVSVCAQIGLSQDKVDRIIDNFGQEMNTLWKIFDLKARTFPFPSIDRILTKRQNEVLQWVSDGKSNQDIAEIMNISIATVEKHLRLIRERLSVETTGHAIKKAAFLNHLVSQPWSS